MSIAEDLSKLFKSLVPTSDGSMKGLRYKIVKWNRSIPKIEDWQNSEQKNM